MNLFQLSSQRDSVVPARHRRCRAWSTVETAKTLLQISVLTLPFGFSRAVAQIPNEEGGHRRSQGIVERSPLPWREVGEGDLRVFSSGRREVATRLEMIRRATVSIDLVTYGQRFEEGVALPLLSALRDAANRGVKVRYLTNRFISFSADPTEQAMRYLCGEPTRVPIEMLNFGSVTLDSVWSSTNFIHEKFLIVDGKWVLQSGRMPDERSAQWLDKDTLIKGPLVRDSKRVFNRIWRFARSQFMPCESGGGSRRNFWRSEPRNLEVSELLALTESERREVDSDLNWLTVEPESEGRIVSESQVASTPVAANTLRVKLHHYDYLQQAWSQGFPDSIEDRLARLNDPILEALAQRIERPGTRQVLLSAMSLMLAPRLKQALIRAVRERGVEVILFTNSETANGTLAPWAINWVYALPDMIDLMASGARIFTLRANDEGDHPWHYLHQKLAIIDDTVFFGSHNYNLPATLCNDEATFEVRSNPFAQSMRSLFLSELTQAGDQVSLSDLRRQVSTGGVGFALRRWLAERGLLYF
jgi:phosphatidylserine/phosphatidylglycerophosphate/cardiolipin synthase-like enzyme